MCKALTAGEDAWGHHSVPTRSSPDGSEDTLLIERVLATGGAYHSAHIADIFARYRRALPSLGRRRHGSF